MAKEKQEICFGKNVSLKASNIQLIQNMMIKTKKNFSATLNILLEQWDEYSMFMIKFKRKEEEKKQLEHFDQIKRAKVIKK